MYKHTTILTQMQHLVDRLGFEKICDGAETNKRYRTFDARTQLFTIMLPQLSRQNGLELHRRHAYKRQRFVSRRYQFVTRLKTGINYEILLQNDKKIKKVRATEQR